MNFGFICMFCIWHRLPLLISQNNLKPSPLFNTLNCTSNFIENVEAIKQEHSSLFHFVMFTGFAESTLFFLTFSFCFQKSILFYWSGPNTILAFWTPSLPVSIRTSYHDCFLFSYITGLSPLWALYPEI